MESIISYAGLLAIIVTAVFCRKERLFIALANAFAAVFAAFVALRYWWLVASFIDQYISFPPGELCFGTFWLLFGPAYFIFLKMKNSVDERDTPVYPPKFEAVLSPIFAAIPAAVFVCGVMASVQISLPQSFKTYDRAQLTIPWDRLMIDLYRDIEENACNITHQNPSHTRFPILKVPHTATTNPLWR